MSQAFFFFFCGSSTSTVSQSRRGTDIKPDTDLRVTIAYSGLEVSVLSSCSASGKKKKVKRRPRSRYRLFTDTVSVLNVFCASQSADPNRRRDAGDSTDSHSQCLPGVPHSVGVVKVLLYVHRNRRLKLGTGAQDGHLDFHTAPEL